MKDHIKNKIIVGENLHTALYGMFPSPPFSPHLHCVPCSFFPMLNLFCLALNIDHSPINKCDLSLYYELYDGIEFQEYKDYHAVFQNWLKEREREDLLEQMKQDAVSASMYWLSYALH